MSRRLGLKLGLKPTEYISYNFDENTEKIAIISDNFKLTLINLICF